MTNQAKILQIAPTPFFSDRGCHIRIEGIVRCLTELGYDNTVCTYHHGREVDGVKTKRISPIKNYTQTEAGPSKYKLWADWKLLWLSLKHYRTLKPVAIHAHLHEGLMIGLVVKVLFFWRRTPLIADMQGSLTGELEAHGSFKKWPFLKWPTRLIERLLMWCANTIICSSSHSLNKIKGDFGIADEKISLAQDGAAPATPLSEEHRAELFKKLSLPINKTIVVYSGALLDGKGLRELKEVISGNQNSDVHFLIIGYPTENLAQFLKEKNLVDHCTLTGRIPFESLPDYLSTADIAIDPKLSDAGEGSGKMLNYLACGLPVLAFDTQNNRDFLPKETTLANNVEEMLTQLQYFTDSAAARQKEGKRNLKQFTERYSWSVTKGQLKRVYDSTLTQ